MSKNKNSKFGQQVVEEINKFRTEPKSIEKKLEVFKRGLSRLRAKDPFLKEIDNFIVDCNNMKKMQKLTVNPILCEAAQNQIEAFSRDEDSYDNYLSGDDLKGIVPDYYLKENPCLIADSGADEPGDVVTKILLNKLDARKIGRNFLTNNNNTQIGYAHVLKDEDNYVIIIMCLNEAKKRSEIPLPEGYDLSELKKAFDLFDVNKEGEINPKETVEAMLSLGYDNKNPELYKIMKELEKKHPENIDFSIFANHIIDNITNKDDDYGLRRIFELFVDDFDEDTMSIQNLKKIVEELGDKNALANIKKLMETKGGSSAKLSWPEFKDYMLKTYTGEQIKGKVKAVKEIQQSGDSGSKRVSVSGSSRRRK
jgi:Ca2+-binding EF-hand superfamily protein